MAGGVFVDRPFHLNPKCVVFSLLLIAAYWTLPPKNPFMAAAIFVVAYVGLAWYDHAYDCSNKMYGGRLSGALTLHLSAPFKPQRRTAPASRADLVDDPEAVYRQKVNLFHLLAANPLLAYVGLRGARSHPAVYPAVLGMGALALVYHGSRLLVPREVSGCPGSADAAAEQDRLRGVYLTHLLGVVPLLLYVGLKGAAADPRAHTALLVLAGVSELHHARRLWAPLPPIRCD